MRARPNVGRYLKQQKTRKGMNLYLNTEKVEQMREILKEDRCSLSEYFENLMSLRIALHKNKGVKK